MRFRFKDSYKEEFLHNYSFYSKGFSPTLLDSTWSMYNHPLLKYPLICNYTYGFLFLPVISKLDQTTYSFYFDSFQASRFNIYYSKFRTIEILESFSNLLANVEIC